MFVGEVREFLCLYPSLTIPPAVTVNAWLLGGYAATDPADQNLHTAFPLRTVKRGGVLRNASCSVKINALGGITYTTARLGVNTFLCSTPMFVNLCKCGSLLSLIPGTIRKPP